MEKLFDRYTEEFQEKYGKEIQIAEAEDLCLGDCDGWLCTMELLDKHMTLAAFQDVNSELWEEGIDTIGIDEEYKTKQQRAKITRKIEAILKASVTRGFLTKDEATLYV